MRNTKKRGTLHFVAFKWEGRYLGICKETGCVEEAETLEKAKDKLINGSMAIIKAVITSKEDLTDSVNSCPPLKYRIFFYIAPLLVMIERIKDSSVSLISFEKSISSLSCGQM